MKKKPTHVCAKCGLTTVTVIPEQQAGHIEYLEYCSQCDRSEVAPLSWFKRKYYTTKTPDPEIF